MAIKKVGIVGCGQMGGGIAQVCAQSGYEVVVSEVNKELLQRGLASIDTALTRSVTRGNLTPQDRETILSRIGGTTDFPSFADCDLMIEAVVENLDLKKKVFAELDKICPKQAILATNTSCLSIMDMAMATTRPEKVLGLHFFNPVPVMKLVEVVRTVATNDETVDIAKGFCQSLGKTAVTVKDMPGFIVNRLLTPFLLNAIRMLEAGVATKEDIDTAVNLGLNHPMGPLALADLIGLDTLYFTANSIYEELRDPQYVPPILMKKMIALGWLGRKAGKGFYEYRK